MWLAHLLVEIPRDFQLQIEELVNSTAIIDHSNMLKPYIEILILSVLQLPPEKTSNRKWHNFRKIVVASNDS